MKGISRIAIHMKFWKMHHCLRMLKWRPIFRVGW